MRLFLLILSIFACSVSFAEELHKIDALAGKISLLAPSRFEPMAQELINIKYPSSRRPTEVLSDTTGGVTLAFNHTATPMQPSQVKEAHTSISRVIHNMYPSAKWLRDEVINQNGTTFMVMELVTPAIDTEIHNIMYGTSVDGRFLLAAFNTTTQQSKEWLPIGEKITSSLSVH